jgi:hypothetical protein
LSLTKNTFYLVSVAVELDAIAEMFFAEIAPLAGCNSAFCTRS